MSHVSENNLQGNIKGGIFIKRLQVQSAVLDEGEVFVSARLSIDVCCCSIVVVGGNYWRITTPLWLDALIKAAIDIPNEASSFVRLPRKIHFASLLLAELWRMESRNWCCEEAD